MRKTYTLLLFICAVFVLVSLSSCDLSMLVLEEEGEHVHSYGWKYYQDAEGKITRTGQCSCGETKTEDVSYEEVFCFNDSKLSVIWEGDEITGSHIPLYGEWVIPDKIGETEVTAIDDSAFLNLMNITSINLPESVTSIGNSAFNGCSALKSINIPAGVYSIGLQAFTMCSSLTNIVLDENNISFKLENGAIYDHEMTTLLAYPSAKGAITIPNDVKIIGASAFESCNEMSSVTIPNTVKIIEEGAFGDCTGLKDTVAIPDSVTTIADGAFFGTYIKSITIPDNVTYLGSGAFEKCLQMTEITIGSGITTIPSNLFKNCWNLKNVTIPATVTKVGDGAFEECRRLESITLPTSITSISSNVFDGCKALSTITYAGTLSDWDSNVTKENGWNNSLPDTYTLVCNGGSRAHSFSGEWTYRQVGDEVQKVRLCPISGEAKIIESSVDEVFDVYSITKSFHTVYVADGITLSGAWTIPTTVDGQTIKRTREYGFKDQTQLTAVTVPETMKSIDKGTFQGCTSLKTVNLSTSMTGIPDYAFDGCTSLTTINTTETKLRNYAIGKYSFRGCTALESIEIPEYITINGENGTRIGEGAFSGCSNLTSITMPTVWKIEKQAFYRCSKLTTADLSKVEELGEEAFFGCGLTSVDISKAKDTNYIGKKVFAGCKLTSITLPAGITSIPDGMFQNCEFTEFNIPSTVKSIGSLVFYNCTGLTSIAIPSGVTSIGDGAFENCSNLTTLSIPASVTSIGYEAFARCGKLTTITVDSGNANFSAEAGVLYNKDQTTLLAYPTASGEVTIKDGVKKIDLYAFENCNSMTKVMLPESMETIKRQAFLNCTSLNTLGFKGTKAQWSNINKDTNWNYSIPATSVICSNGYVSI